MTQRHYTKCRLGAELLVLLEKMDYSVERVSQWADHVQFKNMGFAVREVDKILLELSAMSFGEEFEMTEEEVRKLAITLIQENCIPPQT